MKWIKSQIRYYKLGKHIISNLINIKDFDCGDILKKQSTFIDTYNGTIHTISYCDTKRFSETSILISK